MVGRDTVHIARLLGYATKEISAADDNGDLRAQFVDFADLAGNMVNAGGFNAKALVAGQGLAGKFEQDTFEG